LYEELKGHHLVTAKQIGEFYGYSQGEVREWARNGIGAYTADRLAIKLKVLPFVIWGDAFFDETLMRADLRGGGHRKAFCTFDVREIRRRFDAGESAYAIAKDYDVATESVRQVALRKSYRDVA